MKKIIGIVMLLTIGSFATGAAVAGDWKKYRVTITNATNHHVITPPLIVIHHRHFKLFEVTKEASAGLVILAETGSPAAFASEVKKSKGVYRVIAADSAIVYGNYASFEFRAPRNARISMTGMLATTNDAFTAISGKALPKREVTYMATTYDAGSESNNELCIDIPGPPCGGTNAANDNDGEGFITIHNGVTGAGDLSPAMLDWRGATSIVTVTRLHK